MSKTFTFPVPPDLPDRLKAARKLARRHGITVRGNSRQGGVSGNGIEGSYRVVSSKVTICVARKPFLAPWWLVEKELRAFLFPAD